MDDQKPPEPPGGWFSASRANLFFLKWNHARVLGRVYSLEQFELEEAAEKAKGELERLKFISGGLSTELLSEQSIEPGKGHHGKKPVRRNSKYREIDEALRQVAESRPRTQKEIFDALDGRVPFPPAEPFRSARGWISGFNQDRVAARAWLSKRWTELDLPPLPRGPKALKIGKK